MFSFIKRAWTTRPSKDQSEKEPNAIRIGILGAARIAPSALIFPARLNKDVKVVAVAARDEQKAKSFAKKHNIPKVHTSYDDLINDPEVDAIYNPLPNGLHFEWTMKALDAGKHILCEKPMASNEQEAKQMADKAVEKHKVLMEAFHYKYHPAVQYVKNLIDSGHIGAVKSISASMKLPLWIYKFEFGPNDIRFNYDLAGGITMDGGCYTINVMRHMMGKEPIVTEAKPGLLKPQVDYKMDYKLNFDGVEGTGQVDFKASGLMPKMDLDVIGTEGQINLSNFVLPQMMHSIKIKTNSGTETKCIYGNNDTSYGNQLKAFINEIRKSEKQPYNEELKNLSSAEDAVKNMKVIDDIYTKAGLKLRGFKE
jgi:predicted dehydrogenase